MRNTDTLFSEANAERAGLRLFIDLGSAQVVGLNGGQAIDRKAPLIKRGCDQVIMISTNQGRTWKSEEIMVRQAM